MQGSKATSAGEAGDCARSERSTPSELKPEMRELSGGEVEAVLSRNHVGRVAYSYHDRVDITPVHYVYANGWIYGRTTPGGKLETIRHNWWVAFEVDEVEGLFDWRSVVVHGGFFPVDAEQAEAEREAWVTGLELIRTLVPEAFKREDPAPFRTVLFRIAVQESSGRISSTRVPAGVEP